ncbi:MAG: hypothetical protein MUF30_09350 [Burkholderiales bacterium]|jgi:hypothetical protein|nr:hypothetical protein [Burkholderiales bacterium]
MLLLRILGFLLLLGIGASALMFAFTRDRRWLRFAARLVQFAVVVAAAFLAFYLLERLLIIV